MEVDLDYLKRLTLTRRTLFGRASKGIGLAALSSLLNAEGDSKTDPKTGGLSGLPHHTPKAKRVLYLHQSGAPSQVELFDWKPMLAKLHGTELPHSIRNGPRITTMASGQLAFPGFQPAYKAAQDGISGTWLGELRPR